MIECDMIESDIPSARYRTIAQWFEQLTLESLETIDTIYSPSSSFSDPFNDVRGIALIKAVYTHMFDTLDQPRFTVTQMVIDGRAAFMVWTFDFWMRQQAHTITGCTHFEIDDQGLITLHRDYWDAARQVYEKVPLLGVVLRALRQRMGLKAQKAKQ